MKNKYVVPIICLIGLTSFVVLGSSPGLVGKIIESAQDNPITRIFSQSTAQSESQKSDIKFSEKVKRPEVIQKKPAEQQYEIPEHFLYEKVFRLAFEFNALAKSQEAKGEAVTGFGTYFKDEVKLTDQENASLVQLADDYHQDAQLVDAQAVIVIEQLRQQFPPGSLPEGELIKPSPELLQLQEQRNKLALDYGGKLKVLFGEAKFAEFDRFVKGKFALGTKVISATTNLKTDNPGGEK